MNHKKYVLIALSIILIASTAIVGFLLYNSHIQKNNIKKVALEAKFTDTDDFDILIKSNDGSNFELNSLPTKMFFEFMDGETEAFEEDMVKNGYSNSSYGFFFIKRNVSFKVSNISQKIFSGIMMHRFTFKPIKSIKLQIEGQEFKFENKITDTEKHSEDRKYTYDYEY